MRILISLITAFLLSSCATPTVPNAQNVAPLALQGNQKALEIGLGPVIAKLNPADSIANVQYSWFCMPASPVQMASDRIPISRAELERAFKGVFEPLGYKLPAPSASVFEPATTPRLSLGGAVTKIVVNACLPFTGSSLLNVGNLSTVKGSAFVEIAWELYSLDERRVVYKSSVQSSFEAKETVSGGVTGLILSATSQSLRNLAAQEAFREAVLSVKPLTLESPVKGQGT